VRCRLSAVAWRTSRGVQRPARDVEAILGARHLGMRGMSSDEGPKRPLDPWRRGSLESAPQALHLNADDLEEWVDERIAHFVPMQPWPLNMQQVLDMMDPALLAKYLHVEVPIRVAERIRWIEDIADWQENPSLAEVHRWHRDTFRDLLMVKRKDGLRDFTKVVDKAVTDSEDMPHKLAHAMQWLYSERGDAYGSDWADPWLDNFLLNHIGTNFIMAQYMAATRAFESGQVDEDFAGLIDPHCNVAEICRQVANDIVGICARETKKRPAVKVEPYSASGEDKGLPTFAFIPGYLRVILMEVLKNSCRATADKVQTSAQLLKLPITIIVCADEHYVRIRINDRAGGIPFDVEGHVWSYFYSTTNTKRGDTYGQEATELAGYGIGLPLSRLFAKYLGGSLKLVSLPGYGTSVDINMPRVSSEQVEQVPDDDNIDVVEDDDEKRQNLTHLKL